MPDFGPHLLDEWLLDPAVTYLNHGTVGAPPRRVLAHQAAIRDEIERQPARFLLRELADPDAGPGAASTRMRQAAVAVGEFLGVPGGELAFVDNITTGANAVLRSLTLEPGDEVVVTELGYGGIVNIADYVTRRAGAALRTLPMPAAGSPPEAFVEAVRAGLSPATRLLVIDHVTAETALVLPAAEIVAACHAAGVRVLLDGAHAPGAIPLDLPAIGADWYVGNLHKWAWTPRSVGIVWAAPAERASLKPAVISWGHDNGMWAEFDLPGTRDPSAVLSAPFAIGMMREFGVQAVQGYDHDLAWWAGRHLSERWETSFTTPEAMVGTMVNVALPERAGTTAEDATALRDALLFEDGIEVPVFCHGGRLTTRVSCQVYNGPDDVERLAACVLARC